MVRLFRWNVKLPQCSAQFRGFSKVYPGWILLRYSSWHAANLSFRPYQYSSLGAVCKRKDGPGQYCKMLSSFRSSLGLEIRLGSLPDNRLLLQVPPPTEQPRAYRKVKHSTDEAYDKEKIDSRLSSLTSRMRSPGVLRQAGRLLKQHSGLVVQSQSVMVY